MTAGAPADVLGVVAPAGHGKSELLDALAEHLVATGLTVARTRGLSVAGDAPFSGLEGLIGQAGSAAADPAEVKQAVLDVVGTSPTIVIVDDAHLLDEPSGHLLAAIAEAPPAEVGLVVASRPSPGPGGAGLLRVIGARAPLVGLEPLDDDELADRLRDLVGAEPSSHLVDVVSICTEGVPIFVDRLLADWIDAELVDDGDLAADAPTAPAGLVAYVRGIVEGLGGDERAVLRALAVTAAVDDGVLRELAGIGPDALGPAMEALRVSGLLVPGKDEPLPVVADSVEAFTPAAERRQLHARLAGALDDRSGSPVRAAEHLAAAGATGPDAVAAYVSAGDGMLDESPELALGWYERAASAGAEPGSLDARRAETAVRTGDADAALTYADRLLAETDGEDGARGRVVAAACMANRGLTARVAELLESVEGHPAAPDELFRFLAVPALVGIGERKRAEQVHEEADAGSARPAPLLVEAALLVSRGALEAPQDPVAAIRTFLEAAELVEAAPPAVPLPDTPHALGAVVATHLARFDTADHLLGRAIEAEVGGPGLRARHRCLLAWVEVRAGRWAAAQAMLADLDADGLSPRDAVVHAAARAALGRRSGDLAVLGSAVDAAVEPLLRAPADLWATEPVGELAMAAARLGRDHGPTLDHHASLVDAMGQAPTWQLPLGWARLHMGVSSDSIEAVQAASDALAEIGAAIPPAGVVAAAGRQWASVLSGDIDPAAVRAASDGLRSLGLAWEASRLTGQAAIRSDDPSASRALLEQARELKTDLPTADAPDVPIHTALSGREVEVATCVVDGLTYKEIGAQLFISPKTVEHHVAKIRQKLGASTRAEMLAALRAYLTAV